jgi:tight adherence protein B
MLSAIASVLSLLYPKIRKKSIIDKRKKQLNLQFRDMLYSLVSSVSAGKPVERAFYSIKKDLAVQYPDPGEMINIEMTNIIKRLDMNESIEVILEDLAERSHSEDIKNFSDVFQTSKRAGGNLTEVIRNTYNIINDKLDICQEIEVILAEKKLERRVLSILPAGLVLILSSTAGDYMRPVFESMIGRIVMTISLLIMLAANYVSARIINIKV